MACAGDIPTLETLAAVDLLREALPELKIRVVNLVDLPMTLQQNGVLNRARDEEQKAARQAQLPPITAEQAATIRDLIKETGVDESSFLKSLAAARIDEIKEFNKAVAYLERWRRYKTVL